MITFATQPETELDGLQAPFLNKLAGIDLVNNYVAIDQLIVNYSNFSSFVSGNTSIQIVSDLQLCNQMHSF